MLLILVMERMPVIFYLASGGLRQGASSKVLVHTIA